MRKFLLCLVLLIATINPISPYSWGFIVKDIYSFNEENLVFWLKVYDLNNPEVVLKQAKLETGYYTSNIFKENRNFIGYDINKEYVDMGNERCEIILNEPTLF